MDGGSPVGVAVGAAVVVTGGEVIGCDVVFLLSSLQPQNLPGVAHVVLGLLLGLVLGLVLGGEVEVGIKLVDVTGREALVLVVVTSSLQPNQPGVLHVVVVAVVVVVVDVVVELDVVVVSSKHPHHPGVWHVVVLVRVFVDVDELDVVVLSVPLLSYIFHLAQSLHSGVNLHTGTVSYLSRTSCMTVRIL